MKSRLLPLLAALCASLLPSPMIAENSAAPARAARPKPQIGSTVFEWSKLAVRTTNNGERRDVADNPTATLATFECHVTTLKPGAASHLPHRHPQEELILIKEGTLEVHINGTTTVAGPGSTLFFATNDAHAVKNVGETPATYWVVNFATAATHDESARNAAPKIRSAVYDWNKLEVRPSRVGEGRRVLDGSTVTLKNLATHITTINAGEAPHAAHQHPDDEIVIVREGTLEVTINGKTERAGPGSIIFAGSNDVHGWRNVSDGRASYHVIRVVTAATPKAATATPASK